MFCFHWLMLELSSRVVHLRCLKSQPQYGSLASKHILHKEEQGGITYKVHHSTLLDQSLKPADSQVIGYLLILLSSFYSSGTFPHRFFLFCPANEHSLDSIESMDSSTPQKVSHKIKIPWLFQGGRQGQT